MTTQTALGTRLMLSHSVVALVQLLGSSRGTSVRSKQGATFHLAECLIKYPSKAEEAALGARIRMENSVCAPGILMLSLFPLSKG